MDENGTLDLSMKKPIKREGSVSGASPDVRSPDPSSSSSSSSSSVHQSRVTSPKLLAYKQEEWEGPLDYTKPKEDTEEVSGPAPWTCQEPKVMGSSGFSTESSLDQSRVLLLCPLLEGFLSC